MGPRCIKFKEKVFICHNVCLHSCPCQRVGESLYCSAVIYTAFTVSAPPHTHAQPLRTDEMKNNNPIGLIFFLHGDGHMVKFSSSCSIKAPSSPDGWRAVSSVINLLSPCNRAQPFWFLFHADIFMQKKSFACCFVVKNEASDPCLLSRVLYDGNDGFVPDFFACESN